MDDNIGIDLDALASAITSKTNMIYVCNPNNPTGLALNSNQLEAFCKEVSKKVLVFVDEAYHEYAVGKDYKTMAHLVSPENKIIISEQPQKFMALQVYE